MVSVSGCAASKLVLCLLRGIQRLVLSLKAPKESKLSTRYYREDDIRALPLLLAANFIEPILGKRKLQWHHRKEREFTVPLSTDELDSIIEYGLREGEKYVRKDNWAQGMGTATGITMIIVGGTIAVWNPVHLAYAALSTGATTALYTIFGGAAMSLVSIHDDTRKVFNRGLCAVLEEIKSLPKEVLMRFLDRIPN